MSSGPGAPESENGRRSDNSVDRPQPFANRVPELFRDVMENVDHAEPETALLYARCCAAFEAAVNINDVPVEEALGRMMSAVFEAADQSEIPREHVVESAHHFLEDAPEEGPQ